MVQQIMHCAPEPFEEEGRVEENDSTNLPTADGSWVDPMVPATMN